MLEQMNLLSVDCGFKQRMGMAVVLFAITAIITSCNVKSRDHYQTVTSGFVNNTISLEVSGTSSGSAQIGSSSKITEVTRIGLHTKKTNVSTTMKANAAVGKSSYSQNITCMTSQTSKRSEATVATSNNQTFTTTIVSSKTVSTTAIMTTKTTISTGTTTTLPQGSHEDNRQWTPWT